MPADPTLAVLIPFRNGDRALASCLERLLPQARDGVRVVLVDDGSTTISDEVRRLAEPPAVEWIHHAICRGPGAARNTGVRWCREHGIGLVLLLDSDCIPDDDLVETHIRLHARSPDAVCIGGAIQGSGRGIWARLDGLASWSTSIPGSPARVVGGLYHIPTTNMSLKLGRIPWSGDWFDEALRTGEDVAFVARLRQLGARVLFEPRPVVRHQDRESFRGFLAHQYRWGLHTYALRTGRRLPPRGRWGWAVLLAFAVPAYAVASSLVNLAPWLRRSPLYVFCWPVLLLLYMVKGVALIVGVVAPSHALRSATKMDAQPR